MKLFDLTSADTVKAEALRNPAVRAEWDRTAVAREVASRVVRYRAEHGMSQAELGAKLGVSQPYVARLESGDQSPTLTTLARLAQPLGLEFHIDVTRPTCACLRERPSAQAVLGGDLGEQLCRWQPVSRPQQPRAPRAIS